MNLLARSSFGRSSVVILISLFAVSVACAAEGAMSAPDRTPAPAWALPDLQGTSVTSNQFKGKVVVLDFWATWCPPCRAEIPGLESLYRQYADKGLVIVGISLDQDGPAKVKAFVKQHGLTYPIVMGNEQVSSNYGGIDAIPTTFVINRKGAIAAMHVGYTDRDVFEKEIKPLL
ncbi:MAG: TlpA family protein disulfide reductase [Opitutaceae bacterium]